MDPAEPSTSGASAAAGRATSAAAGGAPGTVPGAATGEDFQPKLVYLARRDPRLTRDGFVARWRRHGALGMSLPRWRNIARYVHCDVLDEALPRPGPEPAYDGVGLIWHRSPAARAAHLADTSSRLTMEQDEAETFAEPVVATCLVARECIVRAPDVAGVQATKLLRVHASPARASRDDDAAAAAAAMARVAQLEADGIAVLGLVLDLPLPPERGVRWGLDAGLLEEWWFDDPDTARRAAALLAGFAPAEINLLTNEVQLY